MSKIKFIALKEIYHILRDPRSLTIAIFMPILMTTLYGYAINLDIRNVTIAVIDFDNTATSRELVEDFYASSYFGYPDELVDERDPETILRAGAARAVLTIAPGFETSIESFRDFHLGLTVDGSDNIMGEAVQNYTQFVVSNFIRKRIDESQLPRVDLSLQLLYNPSLESSHFFVPGLLAVILLMISALLTSITIAREKETGTLEQLLTTPVKPYQVLIGKIIPYVALAFLDAVLVLLFARLMFGIPFEGSKLLLLGLGLIYVATSLSLGILISSLVKTQQVAMMLALTVTMLPSVMLSGFIFAIRNMPVPLQVISHIVPARYFVTIVRDVMLKGVGPTLLAPQAGALVLLMLILLVVATLKFNVRVD